MMGVEPPTMDLSARFTRTIDLYGAEGFRRIRTARVAVAGIGGVGSHAALALARSGVGQLVLVDPDRLTASSLNRHPLALPEEVGRFKVEVMATHLALACPDTSVTAWREFLDPTTLPEVLSPPLDFVVDAIDSVGPKTGLLIHCVREGMRVVSSMGASSRRGPGGVQVDDISRTSGCPLARRVRLRLRHAGVHGGIPCAWSSEPPAPPLEPAIEDQTVWRGRPRRRQPSSICLPGIFGYTLAAVVLGEIAGARQP
jgi:tRNA threonylcarbamoyladenosine dehydratase